jgi:hypothetical protein
MLLLYLIEYLRKSLVLDKKSSFSIIVNNQITDMRVKIGELNEKFKSDDGFLYLRIKSENTY